MALDKDALSELLDALRAGGYIDVVRAGMQLVAQSLIELEAAQRIGAGPYERSPERLTHRNGARERLLALGESRLRTTLQHATLIRAAGAEGAHPATRPTATFQAAWRRAASSGAMSDSKRTRRRQCVALSEGGGQSPACTPAR